MRIIADYIKKYWWLLLILSAAAIWFIFLGKRVPSWVEWKEKTVTLANDCMLVLKDKRVYLKDVNGNYLWKSTDMMVQDAFVCDIDRSGDEELILLTWKKGKYGKDMPFWEKEKEKSYSQHIFIYDIDSNKGVSPKWFASDIGRLVVRMKQMEENPTIFLEEDIEGNNTLWKWDSFGLKNIENEVKFIAYGDNIIHKTIYEYARNHEGGNYDFLYKPFLDEIRAADIAAIQAETVLVDKESAVSGYPCFGSPLEVGEAIADAGFNLVASANNHALDKGIYGIDVTSSFYRSNGIVCAGIQEGCDNTYRPYEIITKNGIRFAVFSYTYGTNGNDASGRYPYAVHYLPTDEAGEKEFVKEISQAKKETDFTVVFVHWGNEYQKEISAEQRHICELFAKASADVIIGSHPHVVQDAEIVKRPDGGEMLVYYSLGNFRADQRMYESTQKGAEASFIVEHTYDGVSVKKWEIKDVDATVFVK